MLEIKHLSSGFSGKTVLDDISFKVAAPSLVGLVGPNGSGKSTLLKAIAGVQPFKGTVVFSGKPLHSYPRTQRVRVLSYVAQHSDKDIPFTVREVVQLSRDAARAPFSPVTTEDKHIVDRALFHSSLEDIANERLTELSGGQIQRVMVARAMAQQASIMLLDEPTNHLDLHHQYTLMELLRHLSREHNTVIVLAIHDLALAARYCDRLLLIHDSHLVGDGHPSKVLDPATLATVFGVQGKLSTATDGVPLLHIKHALNS
ncbi:ABC transporter ATP-binding protein [Corynebacterium singulare]|uniref:ABC-type cobalamin/Fe3+-siderophore transport system, ATPase component n=1 Tax=Corynebacterium singulare TaxID=161899 RepID=A0A0B6EYT5_9CORY|nr:ABC transporter ATP-binding protein [Corynebacterium singulare]AJI79968.1 ABC-type cobalamin/Fe3+-siderophore transport system, ATPase component [Corynebacterium singulare]